VPYNMSAHGLPFTDENQPPQYLPSRTPAPNWSNRGPPGLTYYNNITPWNTSAPNSPVDLGLPFTASPSHFRQPPWNPQTPSPGQSFQFIAHQPHSPTPSTIVATYFKSGQQKNSNITARFSCKAKTDSSGSCGN